MCLYNFFVPGRSRREEGNKAFALLRCWRERKGGLGGREGGKEEVGDGQALGRGGDDRREVSEEGLAAAAAAASRMLQYQVGTVCSPFLIIGECVVFVPLMHHAHSPSPSSHLP